jgi:hypothetical protein
VQYFDIQIRKIEAALPEIDALFRSHVEYALPSTGIYTPPDQIRESMLDTLADSAGRPRSAFRPPIYKRREAPVIHL